MTRILGIDPGLRTTGYGAIYTTARGPTLIEAGTVEPDNRQPFAVRLHQLHDGISEVVRCVKPHVIVIEELYTTYRNPSTAVLMAHARGVLCLAGAQHGIPVRALAHSLVKRALVGAGNAGKDQINRMVVQSLGLRAAPRPNDVSDALALALAFGNVRDHEARMPVALHAVR